jgi:serine protease SohB
VWDLVGEYGLFLAKAVTIVVALLIIIGGIVSASTRTKKSDSGHIEVKQINDRFTQMKETLREALLDSSELKKLHKQEKKAEKEKKAKTKKAGKDAEASHRPRLFVVDFHGDLRASAVSSLREEISAILMIARSDDEVVVRLESPGGMVHGYGLASSQLARVPEKEIPLTVCVDKVAASGGYMMACVADKILAAPFAIIGSIGVVAQLPNFNRLMKKHDIDYEVITAGEYKRTLTVFGENTEAGREKFVSELEDTHELFKDFVTEHRQQVDIAKVATGEIWYGKRAIDNQLVDSLETSDSYLMRRSEDADVYQVSYVEKKSIQEKLGIAAEQSADRLLLKWWQRLQSRQFS